MIKRGQVNFVPCADGKCVLRRPSGAAATALYARAYPGKGGKVAVADERTREDLFCSNAPATENLSVACGLLNTPPLLQQPLHSR